VNEMTQTVTHKVEVLLDDATNFYQKNKTKDALLSLKQVLFMAEGNLRVKAYDLLAKICVDKSKHKEAIKFYSNALKYVIEENALQKAEIYNKIGLISVAAKDLDNALQYQKKCLDIVNNEQNQKAISITLRNLGRIYTLKGEHVNALRNHQKSLEIKRKIGDKEGEARNYQTLAQDLEFAEKYKDAIEQLEKSSEIYTEIGDKFKIKQVNESIKKIRTLIDDNKNYDNTNMYSMKSGYFL
jgi:tetratricopeptide (TPR) repeat protein